MVQIHSPRPLTPLLSRSCSHFQIARRFEFPSIPSNNDDFGRKFETQTGLLCYTTLSKYSCVSTPLAAMKPARSSTTLIRVCRFCFRRSCRSVRPQLQAISFKRLSEFASLQSSAASWAASRGFVYGKGLWNPKGWLKSREGRWLPSAPRTDPDWRSLAHPALTADV